MAAFYPHATGRERGGTWIDHDVIIAAHYPGRVEVFAFDRAPRPDLGPLDAALKRLSVDVERWIAHARAVEGRAQRTAEQLAAFDRVTIRARRPRPPAPPPPSPRPRACSAASRYRTTR